jgi:cold shock CspA family protein/uncharacterized LabA/DUF88 family protein
MFPQVNGSMTKIGVFYDGSYFLYVSNYYNWFHEKKSRISISGLHDFIRQQVAREEDIDSRYTRITDAHYFRARLNANDAQARGNQLYYDRVFDDILLQENVTLHYMPLRSAPTGKLEKSMDMWLALEAFEMTLMRQFDYVVLVASDSDYVPLVRKIGAMGIPVILLSWDFEYVNDEGQKIVTRTSQELLNEVSIPLSMHEIIENSIQEPDGFIDKLFVPRSPERTISRPLSLDELELEEGEMHVSDIQNLKSGYGFINFEPANLFFHYSSLMGVDFNDLQVGDRVRFTLGTNERGDAIAQNVEMMHDESM